MSSIPFEYDYINNMTGHVSPSTVHSHNNALSRYYRRYLIQKAISIFKFKLPDTWALNYWQYCLFEFGRIAVFDSGVDNFGIIPQFCMLKGYNIFYQPAEVVITHPLLVPQSRTLKVGTERALIQLQPNFNGLYDMVSYYADLMAVTAEARGVNIMNSKYAYVFARKNKAGAESFKKMYDQIETGNPAVVIDKDLLDENGNATWMEFTNNLKSNYITPDLLDDLRKIEQRFMTQIGIPNRNTEKRERLIVDERNANNIETQTLSTLWLETMRKGIEQANDLFGLDIAVDFRFDTLEEVPIDE